ncbi:MAG: hypothetical protein DMF86_11580 [Acidobacteria bacterium]|nr:MAG: hypothetical protein DMF86_11580 [Acidobacteriota bacterium]
MSPDSPVYVSGVTGTSQRSDISAQTERLLARADDELRAGGSSLAQAVAVTVYLRDAADFSAMNDGYRRAWQADPPSRTTVVADLLDPDARVQMSFVGLRAGAERVAIHPRECARRSRRSSPARRTRSR